MVIRDYDFSRHTIQDPIHGAITFGAIEKAVIDHPLFQRLHGLRQNSLLYLVFPSANHTRFDHSVGVMHLADRYLCAILRNQNQVCQAGSKRHRFQEPYRVDDAAMRESIKLMAENHYFRILIRLSGLFHDAGHGPLSHLFDKFFPSIGTFQRLLKSPRYAHIKTYVSSVPSNGQVNPVQHEVLSCLIATCVILENQSLLRDYGIAAKELARDVCSVIIGGIKPTKHLEVGNYSAQSLLHDIVSSDLDADRMDYLLRDSHMCGVNYGLYDPDRILKSMCAYTRTDTGLMRVAVRYSGVGALEDLLFSRYQMHNQIYGHKTNRACNAMLDRIRERLKNVGWDWARGCRSEDNLVKRFARFNDHTFVDQLVAGQIAGDGGLIKEIAEKLFLERKLVKRVFEERVRQTGSASPRETEVQKRWEEHQQRLKDKGIWAAADRFENKGPGVAIPDFYLKVLRKDPRDGHYLVYELAEISTVVHYLPRVEHTYRIYCKSGNVRIAKQLLPK